MAFKPWYIRAAEIQSAEERTEFIKGVFGVPTQGSPAGRAAAGIAGLVLGYGLGSSVSKAIRDKKRRG